MSSFMSPSVRRQPLVINIDSINVDASTSGCHDGRVTTLIGATEAAATLGVTKPTLYAYVSRGLVTRQIAVDGRTSLYDRAEIEALARRSRRRATPERPSIDVQIATAITRLHDDSPTYRGRRVLDLLPACSFEQVADLLLTGEATGHRDDWRVDRVALARARSIVQAAAPSDPLTVLALTARSLELRPGDDTAVTARRLLSIVPSVLGGPQRGSIAERLTRIWQPRPTPQLVDAVSVALVLLADHELATSTLAVRVAASVRASPPAAIAAGLDVVSGPMHGAAARASAALFAAADERDPLTAVETLLGSGRRLPGFGHSVYRRGDPRFEPLLTAVRAIPAPPERIATVDAVIREAGRSIGHLPNVDLALGALIHVAELPADAPIFAVARIAGWAAHYDEELAERPVRFRGLSRER
jgi:citrate synthase